MISDPLIGVLHQIRQDALNAYHEDNTSWESRIFQKIFKLADTAISQLSVHKLAYTDAEVLQREAQELLQLWQAWTTAGGAFKNPQLARMEAELTSRQALAIGANLAMKVRNTMQKIPVYPIPKG